MKKKKATQMRGPQKRTIIKQIKAIIKEHGDFTTAEINAESSPCVSSKPGRNELVESFNYDKVEVVTYDRNDEEIDSENVHYEDLSKDVLEEILILAQNWEAECLQDEDRQGKNQL
jgi:hypothetical protein